MFSDNPASGVNVADRGLGFESCQKFIFSFHCVLYLDTRYWCLYLEKNVTGNLLALARRRGLVVSSPPATEEIGAMGREIVSHQGIGW
jgi:hypothetical protein